MTSEETTDPSKEELPPLPEDETVKKQQLQVKIVIGILAVVLLLSILAMAYLIITSSLQDLTLFQELLDIINGVSS